MDNKNKKLSLNLLALFGKARGGETKCRESPESFNLRKQYFVSSHQDQLVKLGQVTTSLHTPDYSAIKQQRVNSYLGCRDEGVNVEKTHILH